MTEERKEHRNKTGLVFCGGSIDEKILPAAMKETEHGDRVIVAADRGLVFLQKHGIVPDLVVGDFDSSPEGFIGSYRKEHPRVEIRTFDPEKDYTDSEIGAEAAVSAGCGKVVIIGGTGTRIDHVLGNLQVLALLEQEGAEGVILDPCNRITIHSRPFRIRREDQYGKYVSFFAYGGNVTGFSLSGFHYTVQDFLLTPNGSRAVSNEIDSKAGTVSFSSGRVLMIESRDMPQD